jgi:Predicted amidophosphoribosyltransferases
MMKWTARMRHLLSRSVDLLGPPDARCLVCGGRRLGQPPQTAGGLRLGDWLCAGCSARIPWIRRPACPRCGRPVFCPDCVRRPVRAFEMNRSAVRYNDDMKEWLALYKFRGDERYGEVLAEMLLPAYERLTAEVSAEAGGGDAGAYRALFSSPMNWPDRSRMGHPYAASSMTGRRSDRLPESRSGGQIWHAVTYVPVGRERAEERGFNQSERLARAAAMRANAPLLPLLRRLRDSGKQSQRGRAERLRAMRAVFGPDEAGIGRLAEAAALSGCRPDAPMRILLVDDIYTTGSTAEACAEAIRAAVPFPVRIYVLTWARS